jgi:PAS domain S-box-containing protein
MKNKQAKQSQEKKKAAWSRIVRLRGKREAVARHKDADHVLPAVGLDSSEPMRKMGIDILGDAPWGTHFCQFYQTKEDLIDILVPYFKTGLENNEFCMWVTSEPLNSEDAKRSLKQAVKNLDGYIRKGQIEIIDYTDWYTEAGVFEADKVLQGWVQKYDQAIKRGFDGLRLSGNTFWLDKKDWEKFADYEAVINKTIGKYKMLAICTYSLELCTATEMLDVEHNHQFSLIRWKGNWKIIESSTSNQMEARLAEQTMIAEALQHSKKEWEKTFNAISDWVAMTELTGRILRTNRAGEDFAGIPVAEIVGQSCCKLVHGSEKHIPGCPLLKMLATGQCATAELRGTDSSQWLMVTADPVTDEQGKIIGAVHITRDITERKRAEEALRQSRDYLVRLTNSMWDSVFSVKMPGRVIEWVNDSFKLTGYEPQECIGRTTEFLYSNKSEFIDFGNKLKKSIDAGEDVLHAEQLLRRKNGQTFPAEITTTFFREKGEITGLTNIVRDITERKKAEEEIQNLAKFPSENPYPVLRIGADGTLLYANAASTGLLSDKNSGVGRPAPPFLLSQKARGQLVKDVLEAGSVRRIEVEHAGRVFAFVAVPVVDAHYVNFYGADITERKKAEQEARDAQQKLIEQHRHEKQRVEEELAKVRDELVRTTRLATIGQVSASIAHDLRNPLGAVRNASYFLRSRLPKGEPKAFEHLEIIDQEVVKADQIITNLLEMVRPRMPNKQAVDLAKTVSEVFNHVRRTKTVRCLTSLVPDPFVVQADPHQLRQAITNIVSNAVDAMKGHGELLVEATRSSDYDTLVFRDTGPGFAPEVRDKLFEPLVTTKATGTGLGLTICRQIVEKHGGTIDAEDCQERGAAIRIRLPRQ